MTSSFFPVDRGLFTSSVWLTGTPEERVLWLWLLGNKDDDGVVRHRELAIADGAKLPRHVVEAALQKFTEPDADSRTRDNDGRRIERTDDGFVRVLNSELYYSRDYSTPRWRRWRERREAARREATEATPVEAQRANALANGHNALATKDKDKDKDKDNNNGKRPSAAPPPALKRTTRSAVTPEISEAVAKFNTVFQRATGRRASLAPDRARDFVERAAEGYPLEFLTGLPVGWLTTLAPDAERIRTVNPDYLLRNGTRTYRRGEEVKAQFNWIGAVWSALDRVRLTPDQAEILRDAGALEWWKSKGAQVATEAEAW